ncbi:hypothetical protein LXL04_002559 [Taraxacum kok-saghyz]
MSDSDRVRGLSPMPETLSVAYRSSDLLLYRLPASIPPPAHTCTTPLSLPDADFNSGTHRFYVNLLRKKANPKGTRQVMWRLIDLKVFLTSATVYIHVMPTQMQLQSQNRVRQGQLHQFGREMQFQMQSPWMSYT